MRRKTGFFLFIIKVFLNFNYTFSNSRFCSSLYTTTKYDQCPNPSTFNILNEYEKALSTWKLNIPVLTNGSDIELIQEIQNRYSQDKSCPYIRQTNKTTCCDGWEGLDCSRFRKSTLQKQYATCHLWGDGHIRTFDGTYYQFSGSCTYKLIGSTTWQINIQYKNCMMNEDICNKKLIIFIAGKTIEIIGTSIINTTTYPSILTIRQQEKNLLDLFFANGVRLKIDHQQTIVIQLDENIINDHTFLTGLCGDSNSIAADDFKLIQTDTITQIPTEFGNQWKIERHCPDVATIIHSCPITQTVIDECVWLTNQSDIFQSCFETINPNYFHRTCLNDICKAISNNSSIQNVRCQLLEAYIDECKEYGIRIEWRSKTGCSKQCPSKNMVYVDCIPKCPQTCQNPSVIMSQCHMLNNECNSGCVCSNGTVYDTLQDECVALEQCTCQYKDIQYKSGTQLYIDCNNCICENGRWSCTNRTCSRTCLIIGDMNIHTFDGKYYSIASKCNHILVETTDHSNYLSISYTQQESKLTVKILDTKVTVTQDGILINGDIRHNLPQQIDNIIIRRATTVFFEIRDVQSNVIVHFDPLTSRIYVKLQPIFVNRIRGLCGTYNYITNDDFLTPNNIIETNLMTFANAYITSSCSVSEQHTDTCLNFPANEKWARLECTNLLKHSIFSTCIPLLVDPTFFLTSCMRDLCSDQSATRLVQVKCSIITALAHACALKGLVIDWMSNTTLAESCQTMNYGQCGKASEAYYSECVSECQSSCTDIDLMPITCEEQCLPGCKCQSNQFYDQRYSSCRTRMQCSCYEFQSNQYIHPSHSTIIKTLSLSNCSCSNGSLTCRPFNNDQCGPTQIYSLNTTLCPRTCSNYLSHYDCGLYGPGCTCPPGKTLLSSNSGEQTCVSIDRCPCQYNGEYYLENEVITQNDGDCQNCTCQNGGIWSCQKISCKKTCRVFGHSHYRTFDGFYYDFAGQCQYILVQDLKRTYRILSTNIPCGVNGKICSKNIIIEYNGITIDLLRGRPILLNDIELTSYDIRPITFGSIHISKLGLYTIIKTDDFIVKWNGDTYIDISVYSNVPLAGLCGNNNNNMDDDLYSSNSAIQENISDMAKSWQTSVQCAIVFNQSIDGDPCGDSIEHSQRRTWAQAKCNLIKMKSVVSNNPFETCIDKLDKKLIENYYQSCLYDACHADFGGDCEPVSTVLTAFAAECQTITKISDTKWRNNERCPIQCDPGKVYMTCGPSCPQTCFTDGSFAGCLSDSDCVDGCYCPNGQVMDKDGECIERNRCPCFYNNDIYLENTRITMKKNDTCHFECECINGSFACDEIGTMSCLATSCTSNQYQCQTNGQCIPIKWKCDRIIDCQDGSDELGSICQDQCSNKNDSFQCLNKQCIDTIYRCDGLPDCRDGSDELNCSYAIPCKEYQCSKSKNCIPKNWICNETADCSQDDTSIENANQEYNQCNMLSGQYFQCQDNFNCLSIQYQCDGTMDCSDGSDEMNCSCTCTSAFSCIHTCQCIDTRRVCDGIQDCVDGSDEFNCIANCAKDEYTCLDGKCLNRTYICDGTRDCSNGEDEMHPDCTPFTISPTISPYVTSTPLYVGPMTTTSTTTMSPLTIEPICNIQTALMDDLFLGKPEYSSPVIGNLNDLNAGERGIRFVVNIPSIGVTILLPLKKNVKIEKLIKLQISKPTNVNRFRLTFLNKNRQPFSRYQILSTDSQQTLESPTIEKLPFELNLYKKIRFLKVDLLDTNDNRPPEHVTFLFQACFQEKKISRKKCKQIDAMNSRYATKIINKIGGTYPVNSTYGHLLKGYGGVTYNTSQAVIDVRLHSYIYSRLKEISVPDYMLNRTNVKKIIVELYDQYHNRLFWEKTTKMKVKINLKNRIQIRYIRISILETNNKYAPYNVTLSIKGCFYRIRSRKLETHEYIPTTPIPMTSICSHANALDPEYAHKIIAQFEGTQPVHGLSFVNFIESNERGVDYATQSPIIIIRFQSNVVGQLNEISFRNDKTNIKKYQINLFDFNNNLLFSNQFNYLDDNTVQIPFDLYVSTVQISILNTADDLPAHHIILSVTGCFSIFSQATPSPSPSPLPSQSPSPPPSLKTVPPSTTKRKTKIYRKGKRIEILHNRRVVRGVTSRFQIINQTLSDIAQLETSGVTFIDYEPSVDVILHSNILIHLSSISIISKNTNVQRFRIELLHNENYVQYKIESKSMIVKFDSLPFMILAGIRITFLETDDEQPPRNIVLSIRATVKKIVVQQSSKTMVPISTTSKVYPTTTPSTPDPCLDIDAMEEPYSEKVLAGLSGTNPAGANSSLLDLIYGKSISFDDKENETVIFVIFKSNIFVYLKYVGLSSLTNTNVKRIKMEYIGKDQLPIRDVLVDYSNKEMIFEPIQDIGSVKITILETNDGNPAKNIRLTLRGCFGIQSEMTTVHTTTSTTTTPTPCHHINILSNYDATTTAIGYVAGTNPISSNILDYFNMSKSISYTEKLPTLFILFKSNIYVELKSILITNNKTNVRKYKIDLINSDQTILQTILIDRKQDPVNVDFYVPISALQVTYLETEDGEAPRNIVLNIDGCFGINLTPVTEPTTEVTTRNPVVISTTPRCHEIDMMNELDASILVDSITGTQPDKATKQQLKSYFNPSSLISYDYNTTSSIKFLIIFKSNIFAEIQSISLTNSMTNVKEFQVDLVDDNKSIVQTIKSDAKLTVDGLTEVGIAAIQITYTETTDSQPPKNIRLSVKGCFGMLPKDRQTTTPVTTTLPPQTTEHTQSQTTKIRKRKCAMLDVMTTENRKLLSRNDSNQFLALHSSNGLSFNSTYGSVDIEFRPRIISNIENVSIVGDKHNIKNYQVTFYDITKEVIDQHLLTVDDKQLLSIDNVAKVRITFNETIDNKPIRNVLLSIHGCFYKIVRVKPCKPKTIKRRKPPGYCRQIELLSKRYSKHLLDRIYGTLDIPEIYKSIKNDKPSKYFTLEFNENIFIRRIDKVSILSDSHHIQKVRLELYDKSQQLLKRIDLSMFHQSMNTNLYVPIYPIHVKYLQITILKGQVNKNLTWSIVGCFDRLKVVKTTRKRMQFFWWTISCIHSNILAGRNGYHPKKSLTPYITGTPLPIGNRFQDVMTDSIGISYSQTKQPIVVEIYFPPGIIGRLYEVGIRSSNVYRIRVELVEASNGVLYKLTSPNYSKTIKIATNPRLTGFPSVYSTGIRVTLLNTTDGHPPRRVTIFTNGCFYKSSIRYTITKTIVSPQPQPQPPTTIIKYKCRYSKWTRWGRCSVTCGYGVQIRARKRLAGTNCNESLIGYRMCQLQPCTCVFTEDMYISATGQKVPIDNVIGYLKSNKRPVHIGDIIDTESIVYTHNCLQFICSNTGINVKRSRNCQRDKCVYLSWTRWSSCQGECGNKNRKSIQYRQRFSINILVGSYLCETKIEYRSCQTPPCFGSCILSSWSKWSACSKKCNLGVQKRSRYYLSIQPNCTDQLVQKRDCNPQCCESNKKPVWSEWGPWGNCSQTCNTGERVRYRTCLKDTNPCNKQLTCIGSNKQIEPCSTGTCFVKAAPQCINGKVWSYCSNACGHSCKTLSCRSCNEPLICEAGCVCPAPLVMNDLGECIELNQCLCQTSDEKTNLLSGQTMTDYKTCQDCSCLNGCLDCRPTANSCSVCLWSEWTSFGICSSKCNGTQTRYRTRSCLDSSTEIERENQACSTNETYYEKGCSLCSCNVTTGEEQCHHQCSITPDFCSNLTTDPFALYEYVPPEEGQCCGTCNRTKKTELCSVKELPAEYIKYDNCVSTNRVIRQQCLGTCISGMICRCCSPSEIVFEQISMECQKIENNSTIIYTKELSYAKINTCSCQECHENNLQ